MGVRTDVGSVWVIVSIPSMAEQSHGITYIFKARLSYAGRPTWKRYLLDLVLGDGLLIHSSYAIDSDAAISEHCAKVLRIEEARRYTIIPS